MNKLTENKPITANALLKLMLKEHKTGETFKACTANSFWDRCSLLDGTPSITEVNHKTAISVPTQNGTMYYIGDFGLTAKPTSKVMLLFTCEEIIYIKK